MPNFVTGTEALRGTDPKHESGYVQRGQGDFLYHELGNSGAKQLIITGYLLLLNHVHILTELRGLLNFVKNKMGFWRCWLFLATFDKVLQEKNVV